MNRLNFSPEDIELDLVEIPDLDYRRESVPEKGVYFFVVRFSDGFLKKFGFVVGEKVYTCLSIDENGTEARFDCGLWGWYRRGVMSSYVPGHEEGDPSEESISPDKFLNYVVRETQTWFGVVSSDYYERESSKNLVERAKKQDLKKRKILNYIVIIILIIGGVYFIIQK